MFIERQQSSWNSRKYQKKQLLVCIVIEVEDEVAVWKQEERELLLREEWDSIRELIVISV